MIPGPFSMSDARGRLSPMPSSAALLALEARFPAHSGTKEEAIRAELHLTPTRFYVLLGRAIDTQEALEVDPMLVHRLRRARDERERDRRGRAIGAA